MTSGNEGALGRVTLARLRLSSLAQWSRQYTYPIEYISRTMFTYRKRESSPLKRVPSTSLY